MAVVFSTTHSAFSRLIWPLPNTNSMPSEYECESCKLTFSVGWFHYHNFSSGYGSQTLLVCTACGTVHGVEHPIRDSAVAERMQVQPGPVIDPPRLSGGRAIHDRDCASAAPTLGRKFPELSCLHCQSVGTLRKDWPLFGAPCPKCGIKIRGAWTSWRT